MSLHSSLCRDKVIFGVSISGIVIGFIVVVVVLLVLIVWMLIDIRRRRAKREAEIKESEKMKKQNADGLERVLIYLAFMGQKGHYKMPKNKYPVDKCKQVLTDPVWDENRRVALLEIAKFYDSAATEKDFDDPNSVYYGLSRRLQKDGEGAKKNGEGSVQGVLSGRVGHQSKRGSIASARSGVGSKRP